jgi:hypothetical protein
MADRTLEDTLAAVQSEDAGADSLIAYTKSLKQRLDDALAGATLSPATQAKVNAIFELSTATAEKLNSALQAEPPA